MFLQIGHFCCDKPDFLSDSYLDSVLHGFITQSDTTEYYDQAGVCMSVFCIRR